jgi:hypothetical protein
MRQISTGTGGAEIQLRMEIQALRTRVTQLEQSLGELRCLLDAAILSANQAP